MAIEVTPLSLPSSADPTKFSDFGRVVKGVDLNQLTGEEFKRVSDLLYKVRACVALMKMTFARGLTRAYHVA
jgi:hypothetical protein